MLNSKSIIFDFISFLKHPNKLSSEISISKKIKTILILIVFAFLLNLIAGIGLSLITKHFQISQISSFGSTSKIFTVFFILSVVIGPLIEEIAYRLPLKPNRLFFALGFAALIFIWISKLYYKTMALDTEGLLYKMICAVLGAVLMYAFFNNKKTYSNFVLFWKNNFKGILYFSVVLFGYMHLFNYEITIWSILFSPIIVLPQIITGFVFTYTRLKFGFIYAIISHSIWNLFIVLLSSG